MGALRPERAAAIAEEMPADDATAALRHLDRDRLQQVLSTMRSERAAELKRLLAYPARTAGGLMTPQVETARAGEATRDIRARLAAKPPYLEALTTVFVVDDEGRVVGAFPPSALLADRADPVAVPSIRVDTRVEDVIDLFALHDVLALPVVDATGKLVGAVAVDDVLEELLIERLPGRRRFGIRTVRRHAPA
jgi:Mg/Co/Ni transporter MgtE